MIGISDKIMVLKLISWLISVGISQCFICIYLTTLDAFSFWERAELCWITSDASDVAGKRGHGS